MQKPQIIIHIGTPKTGTSALQGFLSKNYHALLRHGFLWIDQSYHWGNFLNNIEPSQLSTDYLNNIHNQVRNSLRMNDKTLILSSEAFSGNPTQKFINTEFIAKTLRRLFESAQVKVVVYFRRQDLFYESWYTQMIHEGSSQLFNEFWKEVDFRNFDWERILHAYSIIFGKPSLIVRPYVRELLTGGDIICDFMEILGIRSLQGFNANFNSEGRNDSISITALKVARYLNETITDSHQKKKLRLLLQSTNAKLPFETHGFLSVKQRNEILTYFENLNEILCHKWFGLSSNIFEFTEKEERLPSLANIDILTVEDLAEVTMRILLNLIR